MSSRDDWKAVVEKVSNDFPSYIPVPSIEEIENYKLLTFLLLKEQDKNQSVTNSFAAQQPFIPIGRDVLKSKSKKKSAEEPKIDSRKLCNNDESESKSSSAIDAKVNKNIGGKVGKHSLSPPVSLGTVTHLKVDYGELNTWLKTQYFAESDVMRDAQDGKLLIIYDVIMAEKLDFAGENKETAGYSAEFSMPFGKLFKGSYEWSRSTSNLSRPEEFDKFPIGYKVGKVRARQVKPGRNTTRYRENNFLFSGSGTAPILLHALHRKELL